VTKLRIFQVIEASANSGVPGNQTWRRNLYEPLLDLGHEVVLYSAAEGRRALQRQSRRARATFSQKLLDAFRRRHTQKPIDLFFSYLMDGMVEPGVIDEIRKAGVPTCNFSCNNIHQFDLVDELAPHFEVNLHAERDAREKFVNIGANPLWWPMASNPKYFKPKDLARTIPVSFVGMNYGLRGRYISYLLENGINIHAFGPGWQYGTTSRWRAEAKHYKYLLGVALALSPARRYRRSANLAEHDLCRALGARYGENLHPPVSDEEMIDLYSRSHLCLGFLEVYDGHDASRPTHRHLHLREFEAPMSGALYITGYMEELAEMFEPDKEVLVYLNQYELLDKVRYFLCHAAEAEKIRQAGRSRALRDHTYHQRFRQLFSFLKFSRNG
jgi:spore maturation protein CgeB